MRKLLLALPLALLLVTACESGNPIAPEGTGLQPAGECSEDHRPC